MLLDRLPAQHGGDLNVIVETPRGSRTKYTYDSESGVFVAGKFLPHGLAWPGNFGFIPSTRAGDGDPLDALIVMDEPSYPGCLIRCRPLGVIECLKEKNGKRVKDDRLIVVPVDEEGAKHLRSLNDLGPVFVHDIEEFFATYNRTRGKPFKILGRHGVARARKSVQSTLV
jgi:inorganic pyrophosphatase